MEPISSIDHSFRSGFSLQTAPLRQTQTPEGIQPPTITTLQQPTAGPPEIDLVNQLQQDQVQEAADIFRSLNILANQALEPGQDFENRQNIQNQVEEDISALTSFLDQLRQDDLQLFAAIFQNQVPGGLLDTGGTDDNSVSDLLLDNSSRSALDGFLNIDVRSETGALNALDLTGSIIDVFTFNNTGSSLLESLLEDLTESLLITALQDNPEEDQEIEAPTVSSEEEQQDNDTEALLAVPIPPLTQPGENPPTIIDFAG